ncbi:MAG: hypothetical protein NW206_19740 [Hyphomonadaceae bacterium]|nr:hypothetical protein [Hyphomonadaceae bacterium]
MAGIAYVYPNKPARYEVRRMRPDRETLFWTDDLSEAHAMVCRLNDGKRYHSVFDHLGEDGIFERAVRRHQAAGGTIKRVTPKDLQKEKRDD